MGGGRYHAQRSYGHRCVSVGWGGYKISWVVDFYYKGDRLRYPRGFSRTTDEAGARRFCKRWNITFPASDR